MILRCPQCKFAGAISDTNRLTVDQPLFCPRCQTLIIYPDKQSRRVKWEMRHSWLDLAAFWQTSKNILFHPSSTFTALDYQTGISSSLVYLFVYGSLGQIIGRYWFTLLGIQYGILDGNALNNTIRFGATILSTPFLFLALIFVVAGLIHFVLRMLLAARRPFSATFQVVAYASGATSIFNVIPFIGRFIMPIWALVLSFVGLTKAHQASRKRIFFALLLLLVIVGFSVLGVFLIYALLHALKVLETMGLHL